MYKLALAAASLLSAASALALTTSASAPTTTGGTFPNGTSGAAAVPTTDGTLFSIDGKTQYIAGTNAWWLGHLWDDRDVETTMSELAESGLKVVRVWGFGNANVHDDNTVYYQLITPNGTSINDGPLGINRLDVVITAAEKYGIKLVLPLLNNWDDLGGINTYTAAFGGTPMTFYTNEAAQTAYRGWIEFLVNRHKNSSAIFAWELCNEPRCSGCRTDVIYDWAKSTSEYIKSLDPDHMVTLGDEGWFASGGDGSYAYSGAEGIDWVKNLDIETLDYAVAHLYPDSWGYNNGWGPTWIAEHAAYAAQAGKPVVLEEYGTTITPKIPVISPWQDAVLNNSIAMDQYWQFSTDLPSGANLFDGNAYKYDTVNGSDYTVLAVDHAAAMAAKPV